MTARYQQTLPSVRWDKNVPYDVWYCEAFPLERLRYRDLYEVDPGGRAWRQSLLEDIKRRGVRGGPMVVWNHQHDDPELRCIYTKPYHLRVGRNRMWVFRQLGITHAPCIVTGEIDVEPSHLLDRDGLMACVTDGDWEVSRGGVYVRNKTDASSCEYPA